MKKPLLLMFFSGFAALVYQVLWVRQIGILIGSTAQAAALTVAVFFAGLGLGGRFWGRRLRRNPNALYCFGLLEISVGIAALGHYFLFELYFLIYPFLIEVSGNFAIPELIIKSLAAVVILFPTSFLMGGTLPAMGEHVVRNKSDLGLRASMLYSVNTAGGALGAFAGGFILPVWLGVSGAYAAAVVIDIAVGFSAALSGKKEVPSSGKEAAPRPERKSANLEKKVPGVSALIWIAVFVSGFSSLSAEILWTRLFAQVLQNSVYTYALVLLSVLASLALGAAIAGRLCRLRSDPCIVLPTLMILSGLALLFSPWLFHTVTGGLGYVGAGKGWFPYLFSVLSASALVILLPGTVLGTVMPFTLKMFEGGNNQPSEAIGNLIAVDTMGAILGSLFAGFVLLPRSGASSALLQISFLYFSTGALLILRLRRPKMIILGVTIFTASFLVFRIPTDELVSVAINHERGEKLLRVIEGSHATAAVIERDGYKLIRVNNHYTLGGTGAIDTERNQSLIPIMLHPSPRRIFYLGMGTGITAGAGISFPVEEVVVCEVLPEVITLAKEYFGPYTNGLFDDPRVRIYADDGRHYLTVNRDKYDLIISDLFTPWKAGTGNLYTLEHYRTAAARLRPGGLFVQWIPAYQVSEKEFGIIANTMDSVFEQVILWRGDLHPRRSILALIGQVRAEPLDIRIPVEHGRRLSQVSDIPEKFLAASTLRFYSGNVTTSGLFSDYPLNTDRFPIIEYLAPKTQRRAQTGETNWLTGPRLGELYEKLYRTPGPERDPYLEKLNSSEIGYVSAGRSYAHYSIYRSAGLEEMGRVFLEKFLQKTPFRLLPPEIEPPDTLSGWEED